jgi:phosphoglycerol transferase MdoB-like AlkP superfamily enzyme
MRDTILSAVENNERLFLTHFTSTTHHPWGLPSDYSKEDYWGEDGLVTSHEDINDYLNAVRFVDSWLGEILDLLNDTGIANETLIVFVGDQ